MSQTEREIGLLIQEIANKTYSKDLVIRSGKVVANTLDESAGTVDVVTVLDEPDSPTMGVAVSAVIQNINGVVFYPADDSDVWVTTIDGKGKYGIIKCSDLVKVSIKIGDQTLVVTKDGHVFNGGNNGGVPIVKVVNDNDEALKKYCEAINNAVVAGLNAVGAGTAANGATGATAFQQAMATQTIVLNDPENKKVKH